MPRRPNPDSEANIRRIDTRTRAKKQTHGFQVHFLRGATAVTKMFSDTLYGGKEAARRAARKFKQSAMRRLPGRGVITPRKATRSPKPARIRSRRRR